MDDNDRIAFGCVIMVFATLIMIAASFAVGLFFGAGWGFATFAAALAAAMVWFVRNARRKFK